ncbi:MAG: dCTP deaminase [Candidatus Taylorbacteria bacterium]|nr:dCTP deaminase [Candidatus Taylorbacteria bacterium]
MALSDRKIMEEMKKGDIIIEPFNSANLATSSYDVTLGKYYFREQQHLNHNHNIYNIYNKSHTDFVWGTKPFVADKAKDAFQKYNFNWEGISPDDEVILLEPGETILAHTNEFIGGKNHITTMMKARSSMGRVFIEVCKCAGWGDVGYINRWTMEITNNSRRYTIPLVVGRRIAQLIFFETGPILDKDYSKSGKYQTHQNLAKMKKEWKPISMLPKLHLDRDIKNKKTA